MLTERVSDFLKKDYAVGVLLLSTSILAMIAANTFFANYYQQFLATPVRLSFSTLDIHKPLLLWINDGLMVIFFLLIGLEIKQEVVDGELKSLSQVMLPGIAALGGMLFPALIYFAFNHADPIAAKGWAIPAATDIAFAVGILALLGKKVPASLTTFLLALAIIDDLGAIIIIALFYTENLSISALMGTLGFMVVLTALNYMGITRKTPYALVGFCLWVCLLKSGVHATLAGVLIAFTIPIKAVDRNGHSPLASMKHILHNKVNFFILPLFAFTNAGVEISAAQFSNMLSPIPLGIILGLFLGKQIGVFSFSWLAIKAGFAKLPTGASWQQLYGLSILCGIGFTMSLFVASLAFTGVDVSYALSDRIAILTGSLISGIVGYSVLKYASKKSTVTTEDSLLEQPIAHVHNVNVIK